jgi:hypothetical protein
MTNNMHWFLPLLYSTHWLLHVPAVVCHHHHHHVYSATETPYSIAFPILILYHLVHILYTYYTFLPYFNSLYILLLLCHSICFILQKVFYTLILLYLYVIYFRYTISYILCIFRYTTWSWQTTAETYRSQYIEQRSGTNQCISVGYFYYFI